MVIIEVSPNANCEAADLRVFNDVEAPRPVTQVCLERQSGQPEWFEITGWNAAQAPCPALGQRVDDSGEGLAILVYGGESGLRFKPAGSATSWSMDDPKQWGVPFLLMANEDNTVTYDETNHG